MKKTDFKKAYQRMVNAQRAAMFSGYSTYVQVQYTEANAKFGKLDAYSLEMSVFTDDGIMKASFAVYRHDKFDEEMEKIENFLSSHVRVA